MSIATELTEAGTPLYLQTLQDALVAHAGVGLARASVSMPADAARVPNPLAPVSAALIPVAWGVP